MKSNSNPYILIVDDEPQIHTVLTKLLKNEGYEVQSAHNAEEAFLQIEKRKPDLVILDVMMPRVSGIDICNHIKSNPETNPILVLMLSARDQQADRLAGFSHGADDYVSKPFHLRSLMRKVQHMLEKKPG